MKYPHNMIINKLLIVLLLLFSPVFSTIIYTDISQKDIYIGDRIELTVSLVTSPKAKIIPPETDTGFGEFRIINLTSGKIERKSSDSLTFKYLLTVYKVEQCTIPKLPFIEIKSGNIYDTLFSESIQINVKSAITAEPGDTVKLKDIKPQQSAGTASLLWLWIILTLIFIIALIFLIRHIWNKAKKPPPPPPPKPPYDEAFEALRKLENKNYLKMGLLREYVFELSEILKRYMGRRFETNAAEFTTEEIIAWISTTPFEKNLCKSMEWFYNTTHPVKFAKLTPEITEVNQMTDEVWLFLRKTKPKTENDEKKKTDKISEKEKKQ